MFITKLMNFLAHIFLSGNSTAIRIGNLLGELVKGSLEHERNQNFSANVKQGIRLHRQIDQFTDQHLIVRKALVELRKTQGKFAGIALDILFDHFLAKYFEKFSDEKLTFFADNFYAELKLNWHLLPTEIYPMANSMINRNWFLLYAEPEGLKWVFEGMSKRVKVENNLQSIYLLGDDELRFYQSCFDEFFPELQAFCADWLIENA